MVSVKQPILGVIPFKRIRSYKAGLLQEVLFFYLIQYLYLSGCQWSV